MEREQLIDSAIAAYGSKEHEFRIFIDGVSQWFSTNPKLRKPDGSIIHSVKSRLKDKDHLRAKLSRKWEDLQPFSIDNIFEKVTDLAGTRVLHLHQDQFATIHSEIDAKINQLGDWHLHEPPKAYTWDPESKQFFETLGIEVQIKESFYTSVHYLVRPRKASPICCEVQVRTLFEEIWGEVDHMLNYPSKSPTLACREQLLVLAKVVGAGSRLLDSIFRSSREDVQG